MNDVDLARPIVLRWRIRERITFAKRLAMALRAGMPLHEGLAMLSSPSDSRSARHVIASLVADVSRGVSFADALARFERQIGPLPFAWRGWESAPEP